MRTGEYFRALSYVDRRLTAAARESPTRKDSILKYERSWKLERGLKQLGAIRVTQR